QDTGCRTGGHSTPLKPSRHPGKPPAHTGHGMPARKQAYARNVARVRPDTAARQDEGHPANRHEVMVHMTHPRVPTIVHAFTATISGDSSQPLMTFYDDDPGERSEL